MRLYSSLVESGLNSSLEINTFSLLAEEERFRLVFGRPSTPVFRQLVWQAYDEGYFHRNSFILSKEYFGISDQGRLFIDIKGLEKFGFCLNAIGLIILLVSLVYFTTILLQIGSIVSYASLGLTMLILMPAVLLLMRSLIGFAIAKRIHNKGICKMVPRSIGASLDVGIVVDPTNNANKDAESVV